MLLLNIIFWAAGNTNVKFLYIKKNPYLKPFFITFTGFSMYSIYLLKLFWNKNVKNIFI